MSRRRVLGIILILIGLVSVIWGVLNNNSTQSVFSFFSKTVEVNEGQIVDGKIITTLEVTASSTNVYIIPAVEHDDIEIQLKGEVSSRLTDPFSLNVKIREDNLKIEVERQSETIRNIFGGIKNNINLEIYIPQKMYKEINVTSASGQIQISDLNATELEVNSSSGKISLSNITTKKETHIDSSSGAIQIRDSNTISLDIRASSGNINVSNVIVDQEINLNTSSGQIEVLGSHAKSIQSSASSGSINISEFRGERSNIKTSSGSIYVRNISGELMVNATSGKITIDNNELQGDIDVSTSSGSVEIRLNDVTSAIVDFKGSSGKGKVNISGISFEEESSNRIYGVVGSGQYKITVRTSSGSFQLN
ncbi:DUF4097 family beta strand repeat-containing protein [Alkalihalobacterium elongatum]|uniref:DUF4097 family beta strand repeat-containing protein n=1 Tax=Alkalihalobacterium elongatum TaxID=2675466 RepID=UPI001C1F6FE4|nr:DUF4097 family beta strand repeat-containing protein [Alkalihalobacterium elongatum]